jgi:hypothetical protein
MARAEKFRAVVQRYLESVQQFPMAFEESFSADAGANRWRVPDVAVVDWTTGDVADDRLALDKHKLEVCRRMGKAPLKISTAKLRLELHPHSVLEDLHQCLAVSEWANAGELLVAASIEDPRIIEEVRRFAARYGIGAISFGLDADILDDMPEPAAIENLGPREFDSILSLLRIRRYASPAPGRDYDWQHVTESSASNADFDRFEKWISRCLMEERVMTSREFEDLERGKSGTVAQEYVA